MLDLLERVESFRSARYRKFLPEAVRLLPSDVFFPGNQFVEPPEAVVEKGIEAIRGYFIDLYAQGSKVNRHIKAVIIGQEGAGKTRWVF